MNQELGTLTLETLEGWGRTASKQIQESSSREALEQVRVQYVGRKGLLSEATKQLKDVPSSMRPQIGQRLNELKREVEYLLEGKLSGLGGGSSVKREFDLTLPGRPIRRGGTHILTQTMDAVKSVLRGLNFEIVDGPEWESEHYNFDALNTPADHPARDMADTFYLKAGGVLRTHTSPVQIRAMESRKPPVRIASVGKCFRADDLDPSHSPVFHQVEGLMVGEGVSMAHLKGTLGKFFAGVFGRELPIRFRPSFFPFVEPGAEVDLACIFCAQKGCSVCKQTGWLEMFGAGMVHPRVLEGVKYDAERYTGFAFGGGIERLAMLRHGVDDIRLFYENDLRFLRQFP